MPNFKALFAESSIFTKVILTLFFFVFGWILAGVLSQIIFVSCGVPASSDFYYLTQNHIGVLKTVQLLQSFCLFVIPTVVVAYLSSDDATSFLGLQQKPSLKPAITAILFILAAIPVTNFLAEWNNGMKLPEALSGIEQWMRENEDLRMTLTKRFIETTTFANLLPNLFLIAIVPAISEELFFRGLLQTYLRQWTKNIHLAIWLTAFIFSVFHMQFYGFLPRLLLGAYLGYLFVWSRSLWIPIIAHFINNATGFMAYFLHQKGYIEFDIDKVGTNNILLLVVNVLILVALLFLQQNKNDKIIDSSND